MSQQRYSTLLVVLAAMFALALPRSSWAQFNFITNADNTITITKYTGLGGDVTIPGSINGYPVTDVGTQALFNCTSVTSVTIPDSVTSIGADAFYNCTSLTNVVIPNTITNVGAYAFFYCTSLASVTIPNSITNIGEEAFGYCHSLTNISVDAANPTYSSLNGVLLNKALDTLIQYPDGLKNSTYTIPDSVNNIGKYAFVDCTNLISVTIPGSVTSIGGLAFDSCTRLASITIASSVASIGAYAFYYCTSLKSAYFQGNAPEGGEDDFINTPTTVFYLPGTTGWAASFGWAPTELWYQPQPEILSFEPYFGVHSGQFNFTISWATNATVVVEASTNLQDWIPVITNTLVNGTNAFEDPAWTGYPQRFYHVRSQ